VTRAGPIISQRHRRILADEYRTGIFNLVGNFPALIPALNVKMLRGKVIGLVNNLLDIVKYNNRAVISLDI